MVVRQAVEECRCAARDEGGIVLAGPEIGAHDEPPIGGPEQKDLRAILIASRLIIASLREFGDCQIGEEAGITPEPRERLVPLLGLDRQATEQEVRETIIQSALFVGFPNALGAMKTFQALLRKRQASRE